MNLNEDVEYFILEYLGIKCHQCHLKLNSINLICNSKKYNHLFFCSDECFNFV